MSQDSKHPARALSANRRGLLNELDDIRSLLGDGLPGPGNLDDLDIPLLQPEGDAHTQIPLLGSEPPVAAAAPPAQAPLTPPAAPALEKAIAERENPFLPRATMERLAQHHRQTPQALRPAAPAPLSSSPPPATPAPAASEPRLDDRAMRAIVDEILAAWMPRIERELRTRLLDELRGDDD